MNKLYEIKYQLLEDEHWWFVTRRMMIISIIESLKIPLNSRILEVGCSCGPLLTILKSNGYRNLTGIDISEESIKLGIKRGVENISIMDGCKTTFADNSFDLIIASDVLEHIEDDVAALNEWGRILSPNGMLIVFVPAFQFLWTHHDTVNMHFRRYSTKTLVSILNNSGYKLKRISFWNFFLFFPTSAIRLVIRLFNKLYYSKLDHLIALNIVLNRILILLLSFENLLLKYISFPVGVSLFAIARNQKKE